MTLDKQRWSQVETLYHAALEREPLARAAFLEEACAGDEELRHEVESMLDYDKKSVRFTETPGLGVAAGELAGQSLSGAQTRPLPSLPQISGYQLLAPLGRGGMGEVHLALDTRLGRKVAVKILPAEFTTRLDRVRRFAQEARAASALNHPNIITIHEIGEIQAPAGDTHYIVTEYVEGETLRQRMMSAPDNRLQIAEAIDVATQVAAALTAAHEAGIAHRDIKPENVMVRRDGIVKVLDFGLAKLTEPSSPIVDTQAPTAPGGSTESGVVMGTPRYMSPEQARGEKMDARTDIFSLGVMLYEIIAGRAPFEGATTSEVIAAILRDTPPPLSQQVPETPRELERIVSQALYKERAERYQTAKALLDDLNHLKEELVVEKFVALPSGGNSRSRTLPPEGRTRNKRRFLIALGGIIISIAAAAAWFYFNRPPVLTNKDTILLADIENKTGEEIFDMVLKQGLAIQLQQSPFLNLFPDARIRQTLRLMGRAPDDRVTREIGREICQRQGLKAFIFGTIVSLGRNYVITLEALNGQTGDVIAQQQVEGEGKEQVLKALSHAASQMRQKLGESLTSIQQFDAPLELTTSSLEALKSYSLGSEQTNKGNYLDAIPFYRHSVELDSSFAYAYGGLAVNYNNIGQPKLAAEFAEKAFALKDRISEIERLRISLFYYYIVLGNLSKAAEVLEAHKLKYPRDSRAKTNLSAVYILTGQFEKAIEAARESITLNPTGVPAHMNLGESLLYLNRYEEARGFLERAVQQKIENTELHSLLYQIAFINDDISMMQQQVDWARGKPDEYMALNLQTGAAAFAGKWRNAQELSRRAIDLTVSGDTKEVAAQYATEQALRGAVFRDCGRARVYAGQGLRLERKSVTLSRAALAFALCGEAKQAQPLVDELRKLHPEDTHINELWLPSISAAMELQRGNATQAIERLQPASRYEAAAEFWPQYLRGQAYLQLKQGVEAAAEFQKILDRRGYAPFSPLYSLAHLGSARAAAMTGETAKSRKAYENFFAAWKDADPGMPAMIEAKREYEKK